jgi:hypothetical protein
MTLARVCQVVRRTGLASTPNLLLRGKVFHEHLLTESYRPAGVKRLKEALRTMHEPTDVGRMIGAWWASKIFGWQHEQDVRHAVLKLLIPLLHRVPGTQDRELRPKTAVQARALWAQIVAHNLQEDDVFAAVGAIRPKRRGAQRRKNSLLPRILRDLRKLVTVDELEEVLRACQVRMQQAASLAAAGTAAQEMPPEQRAA